VTLSIVGLVVLAVLAFTIFEPVQVLPRIRIAPGFAFVDQSARALTSEDGAGTVTLYSFAPTSCGEECDPIFETMGEVTRQVSTEIDLGGAEFRAITVALDTDQPDVLAAAAADSGADGESWRWVGGESEMLRTVVGGGFGVYYDVSDPDDVAFDQTYVIVDGTGLIRGEYTYATLASDTDRLTRHIGLLGEEIRNSDGNTALLYEAAHVFLCYP
jgi:protein SCO1/2